MKQGVKIVWMVLLLTVVAFSPCVYADPPLPTPVGRVVWVKGTLKAMMENNEQRLLQKTSVIYLHDILTTDEKSEAQIVFTDNTLMTFYPNTKFVIDKYAYQPKKKGSAGHFFMNLLEGGFRTITGLIAKRNNTDYQINTPVATIGVRGTDYAAVLKNKQLFIGNYAGKACVTNKVKPTEVCLNDKVRYATVAAADSAPVPLSEQPDALKEKLTIVPATIAPFATEGGVITSFCISQ